MKIGILIPTRGDRPKFLDHALYLLSKQILNVDFVEVVDDKPKSKDKDITWRYKVGCERLVNKGADVIFFWEDDDYYKPEYLLKMFDAWENSGKPKIFGINHSIYYHLKLKKWFNQVHEGRASAYCTMVTKDIVNHSWPEDSDPFTDIHLWNNLKGKAVSMPTIAIGIKHGVGLCGGGGHTKLNWYQNIDSNLKWLASHVDKTSLDFYADIANSSE